MADNNNNNSPKGNNPTPNGKGVGGNGPRKSPSKSWLLYILYAIIIIPLGIFLLRPDSSSGPHPIGWAKLESILVKHDYSKIVIVNQEYAEVYIKNSAIKSDTSYNDLVGKNLLNQDISSSSFYRYDFVTFESFEKDLEKVEEQTGERIDLVPVKRTSLWRDMLVVFGPFLLLILFFVFMSRISQKQMGGGGGGIFGVGKSKAKVYDGKTPTNVTFKDVAGLAGAKEEVMEVVDFLKNVRFRFCRDVCWRRSIPSARSF